MGGEGFPLLRGGDVGGMVAPATLAPPLLSTAVHPFSLSLAVKTPPHPHPPPQRTY
jgi:hypothetical protein